MHLLRKRNVFFLLVLIAVCASLSGCSATKNDHDNRKAEDPELVSIHAEATDVFYEYGDVPSEDNIAVTAAYSDGTIREVDNISISSQRTNKGFDVTVLFQQKRDTLFIPVVKKTSIQAFYNGRVMVGDTIDPENIEVKMIYEDGFEKTITDFRMDLPSQIDQKTLLTIDTDYGQTELIVTPVTVTHTTAEYNKKIYIGDTLDRRSFRVTTYYSDGSCTEESDFSYTGKDIPILKSETVIVKTKTGESKLEVTPLGVRQVHPVLFSQALSGKSIQLSGIVLVYEDGDSRTVPIEEVSFITALDRSMQTGTNEYVFTYNNNTLSFVVEAKDKTNVDYAKDAFQDELQAADQSYVSDTIFVTINKKEDSVSTYYLAHIVINDPSQLRSELSYNSYGGERELPTSAAKRLNWVIGTNASNFDYATGTPTYAGCVIKDRRVMEGTKTNGMEICLMANGVLFSPDAGVDPYLLVASDTTDSWSCGDTLLINDGYAVNVGIQSQQYRYPRTAIGMVQPCEYYLLVSGSANYNGGLTYDEVRDILMSHGCSFGKCMDGGGSSSLVFRGNLVNNPAVNNQERAVCDFLYFTE